MAAVVHYCKERDVPLRVAFVSGLHLGDMDGGGRGARVVPARNAMLLAIAANLADGLGADQLVIGANAADYRDYTDCRVPFLRSMTEALGISVWAPLIAMSKAAIVARAVELGIPRASSWSCYGSGPEPCHACPSCIGADAAWNGLSS